MYFIYKTKWTCSIDFAVVRREWSTQRTGLSWLLGCCDAEPLTKRRSPLFLKSHPQRQKNMNSFLLMGNRDGAHKGTTKNLKDYSGKANTAWLFELIVFALDESKRTFSGMLGS